MDSAFDVDKHIARIGARLVREFDDARAATSPTAVGDARETKWLRDRLRLSLRKLQPPRSDEASLLATAMVLRAFQSRLSRASMVKSCRRARGLNPFTLNSPPHLIPPGRRRRRRAGPGGRSGRRSCRPGGGYGTCGAAGRS